MTVRRSFASFVLPALCIAGTCPLAHASGSTVGTAPNSTLGTARGSTVRLSAALSPERLGAATTVTTSLRVIPARAEGALPITKIELLYPAELGFGTSELGLEDCLPAQLEAHGSTACPPDSLMGRGSALVQVPFGPRTLSETAPVTIFSQPVRGGKLGLLFLASGTLPVIANLVFGAFVGHANAPFGGVIETTLPPVPSVPKGPDTALVGLRTTIGAADIVYRERVKGRTVTFHPRGMLLPRRCPRGGFPFAVHVSFSDGSGAGANAKVPCPPSPSGTHQS